jgi:predicted DNA-binding transcriptional regulator YafY
MLEVICHAIRARSLLSFDYRGKARTVEPHICGRDSAGDDLLTAWLVRGYSQSSQELGWRTYQLAQIQQLRVLDERFEAARAGFNPADSRYVKVHCMIERQ